MRFIAIDSCIRGRPRSSKRGERGTFQAPHTSYVNLNKPSVRDRAPEIWVTVGVKNRGDIGPLFQLACGTHSNLAEFR